MKSRTARALSGCGRRCERAKVAIAGKADRADARQRQAGLLLAGKRHVVYFLQEPSRFAGNVLIWPRAGLMLRLEGPLTEGEALAVARGVR